MFSADYEPENVDQRRAARLPVSIEAELDSSRRTLCKVLDISMGGVRIRTYSALKVGSRIWLTLPLIGGGSATVKWADDFNAGCQFAKPLSSEIVEALLTSAGQNGMQQSDGGGGR